MVGLDDEMKTVFISGGASGIGLASAKQYLKLGYKVGIFDISTANIKEAKIALGSKNTFYGICDISDEISVEKAMNDFMKFTGNRLDLLLANAGVVFMGNYEDKPLSYYKKVIDINTFGVLTQINAGLPFLKTTTKSAIIVTSSASSVIGIPLFAVYSGTKHFTTGLVNSLNIEFKKYDIFVGDVLPSFVKTKMEQQVRDSGVEIPNLLTPEMIANEILKLETKRKKVHVVIGEFKKLALVKRLFSQNFMQKTLIKEIYNPYKETWSK